MPSFCYCQEHYQVDYIQILPHRSIPVYKNNFQTDTLIIDSISSRNHILAFSRIKGSKLINWKSSGSSSSNSTLYADSINFLHIYFGKGNGFIVDNNDNSCDSCGDFNYSNLHDYDVERLNSGWDNDLERFAITKNEYPIYFKKIEEIETKHRSCGLAFDYYWEYANEYSNAISVKYALVNLSKDPIKYIWLYISCYDAVQGKLTSRGKEEISMKGIGPIYSKQRADYTFDNVFWSKVVDDVKVDKITVQYMNGKTKTINKPSDVRISNDGYIR